MPERFLALDAFLAQDAVVLIDCEFTCWNDSMRTSWADPAQPPELIEIALARYRRETGAGETFTSFVRPHVNPRLSDYCRGLTGIRQADVDEAPDFAEIVAHVGRWLGEEPVVTCGWGPIDREFTAREAARRGLRDPFRAAPHGDVHALLEAALGAPPGTRDAVRARWRLAPNQERHRALADALDLVQFCVLIRGLAGGERARQ